MTPAILVVDDDTSFLDLVGDALHRRGIQPRLASTGREAAAALATGDVDAVLVDLHLRAESGLDLCRRVTEVQADLPVIVITAYGSMDAAVAAIRAGAYDFVSKPVDMDVLALTIERAIQHRRLRAEVRRLREAVSASKQFDDLVGASVPMQEVFDLIDRLAPLDTTVLVTGESGTGKELVARALHRRSRRRDHPFVALNCAAIPEPLLESQLFGHAKGAFTDATTDRRGMLLQAHGGTLFLDEVGDLPLPLQPKLLRVLQERVVRPLGSAREVPFDVRIVAATNRDLETWVDEGRFREDLFFRINVVRIDIPPLRARGSDVLELAQRMLSQFATRAAKPVTGLTAPAAERLLAYKWPGNVRELQNCMERAVALTRFEQLTVEDLPEKIRVYRPNHVVVAGHDPSELPPLEEVERRYILRVLDAVEGSRTKAARVLGLDRKTLYRKLLRYGAARHDERDD